MAVTDQLLAAKLHPPLVSANRVLRPRLFARLEDRRPVCLISAPAGFGKTTLVSEWIQKNHYPVAWLSLDEADNDPARFWSYIIAALQQIEPTLGETTNDLLHSPQAPSTVTVLTELINQIAILSRTIVLVLDDYHVINAQPIHEALTFLLNYLPAQLHLIIITRADPPLPMARQRSNGQLTEIRATDLRFNTEEIVQFLTQSLTATLSGDDIAALEARTEGWIVGLQLVGLSMKDRQDVSNFVESFTGSHRYIIDYLVEDVLAQQPEPIQNFLLHTAILERLQGSLCEAVMGWSNGDGSGQSMLEQLERANLFLTPLDDQRIWYRYHQLFAEALRHYLQHQPPSQVYALHQRASIWYEQRGFLHQAVHHALEAKDFEEAARLMEQAGNSLVSQGEIATLQHWIAALPNELVRSHVEISIWQGWLLFVGGNYDEAERHLEDIEHTFDVNDAAAERSRQHMDIGQNINKAELFGRLTAIRASIAIIRGDLPRTIELSHQALKYLAKENMARAYVAWYLGKALWISGLFESASAALKAAIRISREVGHVYVAFLAVHDLAQLQISQGRLHEADQTYQQAFQKAMEQHGNQPALGPAYIGRANLEREWNHLDMATSFFEEGIKLCEQTENTQLLLHAYIGLAFTKQAQGDAKGAAILIQKALQSTKRQSVSQTTAAQVEAYQSWLALMQGDEAVALGWAHRSNLNIQHELNHVHEREYLTLVRVLIRQSKLDDAMKWLNKLAQLADVQVRMGSQIEILILQAEALYASGDRSQAVEQLARALSLAQPEGYVRLFVDEGVPVARLLVLMRNRHDDRNLANYRNQLLSVLGEIYDGKVVAETLTKSDSVAELLDEPLTERELEILRLIVAGYSNKEIAERLVIALSTVKWYINIIYEKLQVGSRTKAIVRARELNLV